jgi:hypothetical protein
MTRLHHKFQLAPKLSLRGQLERLDIIKEYNIFISASWQKKLYLNAFHLIFGY